MTLIQVFTSLFGNRALWASVGVMLAVLVTWIGYPSRHTAAGEGDGQSASAAAQVPAAEQSLADSYSSWLAGAHEHVMKSGQGGSLPDQF